MQKLSLAADQLMPGLLIVAAVLVLSGIGFNVETSLFYWSRSVLGDHLWWSAGFVVTAGLCYWWRKERAPLILIAVLALYLFIGAGPLASGATLVLFASAWSLGYLVLRAVLPIQRRFGLSPPLLCGLTVIVACFSVLVHFPLNVAPLYWLLLLLPLALVFASTRTRRSMQEEVRAELAAVDAYLSELPYHYCVGLLLLIGLIARHALIPSLFFDDNVLHLRLWTELDYAQRASFDVVAQVWAVAPFAVDLLHAIASLMAGADARAALNFCFLAILLQQLWGILHWLRLSPCACVIGLALFLSTPMTGSLLLTLQTELFLAVLATSGVYLLLRMSHLWYSATLLGILAAAALAAATKLPGIVLGGLMVLAALYRHWPLQWSQWREQNTGSHLALLCFIALAGIAALHSYVNAWIVTGNPVFPLYNSIFLSPYYESSDFSDMRWLTGFNLQSYWNLFFATSRHHEGLDFAAGFQYLALLPLGLLLVFRGPAAHYAVLLLLPLLGFGLTMFSATQYWRYLFPVVPLASVVIGLLLFGMERQNTLRRITTLGVCGLCLTLNLWFYPGISGFYGIVPSTAYWPEGRERLIADHLPERHLTSVVNERAPGSRVLYHPDSPLGATLHGDPYFVAWYAPSHVARVAQVTDLAMMAAFLREEGIDYVIWNMDEEPEPQGQRWLMREYLLQHAHELARQRGIALFALAPEHSHLDD